MTKPPDFGINAIELKAEVERLLLLAAADKADMGAVNWSNLHVCDIQYRMSLLTPTESSYCVVMIEEAAPDCRLPQFLHDKLGYEKFPNVYFECEW